MRANLEVTYVFDKQSFRAEHVADIPFVPPAGMNLSFPATAKWHADLGDHFFTVSGVSWDSTTGELWILFEDERDLGLGAAVVADELRAAGWRIAWSSVPTVAACGVVVAVEAKDTRGTAEHEASV